jgi:hypothetical protein
MQRPLASRWMPGMAPSKADSRGHRQRCSRMRRGHKTETGIIKSPRPGGRSWSCRGGLARLDASAMGCSAASRAVRRGWQLSEKHHGAGKLLFARP